MRIALTALNNIFFKRRMITWIKKQFLSDSVWQGIDGERIIFLTYFAKEISNFFSRFEFREATFNMIREMK